MTQTANARADDADALKAWRLFGAKFNPDHTTNTTPCTQCQRFYSPHLQTRRQQWSACNLSATRDSGRTCRWFAPDER